MAKLTETQAKALAFIQESVDRSGVAPTLREICAHMGYSAVGSAQDLVAALKKKGFLEERGKQAARSLVLTSLAQRQRTVTSADPNTFEVPCLGAVPAGNPLEAVEERVGTLRLSMSLIPAPRPRADHLFALQATGDSMIEAGILDGDWLVVAATEEPSTESVVVARLHDDVTVKRLRRHPRYGWYLQPENSAYAEIYAEEQPFELVGRVVALQRSLG